MARGGEVENRGAISISLLISSISKQQPPKVVRPDMRKMQSYVPCTKILFLQIEYQLLVVNLLQNTSPYISLMVEYANSIVGHTLRLACLLACVLLLCIVLCEHPTPHIYTQSTPFVLSLSTQ